MISATSGATRTEFSNAKFQLPSRQEILSVIVSAIDTSPDHKMWHGQSWREGIDLQTTFFGSKSLVFDIRTKAIKLLAKPPLSSFYWRDCADLPGTCVKDLIDNLVAGVAAAYTRESAQNRLKMLRGLFDLETLLPENTSVDPTRAISSTNSCQLVWVGARFNELSPLWRLLSNATEAPELCREFGKLRGNILFVGGSESVPINFYPPASTASSTERSHLVASCVEEFLKKVLDAKSLAAALSPYRPIEKPLNFVCFSEKHSCDWDDIGDVSVLVRATSLLLGEKLQFNFRGTPIAVTPLTTANQIVEYLFAIRELSRAPRTNSRRESDNQINQAAFPSTLRHLT